MTIQLLKLISFIKNKNYLYLGFDGVYKGQHVGHYTLLSIA